MRGISSVLLTGAGGPALYRVPLPLVGGYSYLAARAIPPALLLPHFRRHSRAAPAPPREARGRPTFIASHSEPCPEEPA